MKKIFKNLKLACTVVAIVLTQMAFSQTFSSTDRKTITVTGSAEMSIDPDEVELSITIHCNRTDLEKTEKKLEEICKKHNIPDEQLSFKSNTNVAGFGWWHYWWDWWYYRNSSDIVQTYKLKINAKTNMLDFTKDLNQNWVRNIAITSTSNKNITMFRKEVKKEAIRMAKEKATYLLEAIDEKIGSVVSIEELATDNKPNNYQGGYHPYYGWGYNYYGGNNFNNSISNSNMNSNSVMNSSNSGGASQEDDKIGGLSKIKLRYEVKAVFEIK